MEIKAIKIADRSFIAAGGMGRSIAALHREAAKGAYAAAGEDYHRELRPKRFTREHAKEAGFQPRAGENLAWGSKAFWKSYTGRKLKKYGHTLPLVFTGRTRDRAQMATITSTSNRGQVKYQVNVLNYIPWAQREFVKVLPRELEYLGQRFDFHYDRIFNRPPPPRTKTI
jgi:hypothetical protein